MTNFSSIRVFRRALSLAVVASAAQGCASRPVPTLASLCSGRAGSAHVVATLDTTRPAAGPELAAARGSRFDLRLAFAASTTGADTGCTGAAGAANFTGDLPDRLRGATSQLGAASWRIEGDTVYLDLNPGTRDNNVFVALPLHGGRGHWGLSTFAGEVASGSATALP